METVPRLLQPEEYSEHFGVSHRIPDKIQSIRFCLAHGEYLVIGTTEHKDWSELRRQIKEAFSGKLIVSYDMGFPATLYYCRNHPTERFKYCVLVHPRKHKF